MSSNVKADTIFPQVVFGMVIGLAVRPGQVKYLTRTLAGDSLSSSSSFLFGISGTGVLECSLKANWYQMRGRSVCHLLNLLNSFSRTTYRGVPLNVEVK